MPMLFLIEDEPDIRESLAELLEGEGYEVRTAANGREALKALENLPVPGLIVLDLLMPVMNGDEFLQEQRKNPRLANVPVVVLSADNQRRPVAGVKFQVKKPVELDELLDVLKGAHA
jgi:CheY-like chemotaxis protein